MSHVWQRITKGGKRKNYKKGIQDEKLVDPQKDLIPLISDEGQDSQRQACLRPAVGVVQIDSDEVVAREEDQVDNIVEIIEEETIRGVAGRVAAKGERIGVKAGVTKEIIGVEGKIVEASLDWREDKTS